MRIPRTVNSVCNFIESTEFNRFCTHESMSFNVLQFNIRSVLGNKFDELCLNLNENKEKFSVIVFRQTCVLLEENHPILEEHTSNVACRNGNRNNGGVNYSVCPIQTVFKKSQVYIKI